MLTKKKFLAKLSTKPYGQTPKYYEVFCLIYTTLIISGNSIVTRFFPFHIPATHIVIPFGAGIIFFPVVFLLQDITTEVYGFARSRRMVWLSVFMLLIFVTYTQIAVHLPSGTAPLYARNKAFSLVFNSVPRQVFALIVSLATGSLLNDFFMSKSKIILKGRYLWMRAIGSSMVGEATVQVVGGVIGFLGTLKFGSQLLPNMFLAYLYKLLWDAASLPLIYLVCNRLKKAEKMDTYDRNISYNPFSMKV